VLVAAAVFSMAALHTDGTNDDDPGYRIAGGSMPGVEHYPTVRAAAPLAYALHYNPGPGTWTRPAPEPTHQ
jgi:hypothetical protein